jgi:ribonuclease D
MTDSMIEKTIMVTSSSGLAASVAQLKQVDAVALDTEFIRTDTFYPRLALIQLCDGLTTWLIDPLAFSEVEFAPLVDLLVDEQVVKIIHSCSEDLEVLRYALGALPQPIFDTQVAAAFVGLGFSLSYQALVKEVTGVELSKHETRSDWLQRPLSDAQLRYAAEDVHYLDAIYAELSAQLNASDRLSWLQEDMATLIAGAEHEVPVEEYYRRIKGGWKLDGQALAVLKTMSTWREIEAREQDRPRGRIVADKDLLQIAISQPRDAKALSDKQSRGPSGNGAGNRTGKGSRSDDGLHPRAVRVYGDKLIDLVEQGLNIDPELYPDPLSKPVPKEQGGTLKACKKLVQDKADALAMAPEILARKADLTYLLHSMVAGEMRLSSSMENSWRKAIIGDQLLAFLEK